MSNKRLASPTKNIRILTVLIDSAPSEGGDVHLETVRLLRRAVRAPKLPGDCNILQHSTNLQTFLKRSLPTVTMFSLVHMHHSFGQQSRLGLRFLVLDTVVCHSLASFSIFSHQGADVEEDEGVALNPKTTLSCVTAVIFSKPDSKPSSLLIPIL